MANVLRKILKFAAVAFRLLMGIMWSISGFTWFTRENPQDYLVNALTQATDGGLTYSVYLSFLQNIVLPNQAIFTFLVSSGELLVGISLLTGTITRAGAVGAIFLLTNYTLMNGGFADPFIWLFLTIHSLIFLSRPGRTIGIDGYLHKRRPKSIWW